jgi:hypothetical protein
MTVKITIFGIKNEFLQEYKALRHTKYYSFARDEVCLEALLFKNV